MADKGKLLKKIRRKQAQFLASEPRMGAVTFLDSSTLVHDRETAAAAPSRISSSEDRTYSFFIGNGGTRNGIGRELLSALLATADSLYMPESKDFSFARVTGGGNAVELLKNCNGICVQDACRSRELSHLINSSLIQGPPLHLYLSLVDHIPAAVIKDAGKIDEVVASELQLPPGLILIPRFVSETEEVELLDYFTGCAVANSVRPPCTCNTVHSCSDNFSTDGAAVKISLEGVTEAEHTTACSGIAMTPDLSRMSSATARTSFLEVGDDASVPGGGAESLSCFSRCSSTPQPPPRPVQGTLKHRSVRHYGYEFLYGSNTVDPDRPLPGGLPSICSPLLERVRENGLVGTGLPDQLTVNIYLPGAGIPPHVDTHSPFEDGIISLSLGSQVVMDFRHPGGRKVSVFLQRRSLLVMTGESRYLWTHGISARKTDEVHSDMPGYDTKESFSSNATSLPFVSSPHQAHVSTVMSRSRRVSLTFRKVRRHPCTCCFPSQCDPQKKESKKKEL